VLNTVPCKAAAIVPSWNREPDLRLCLEHLLAQRYEPLEIIVVDNGSDDGSSDMVRDEFPTVRLIANRGNLGASVAKNQGVAATDAEFVWFLDSDSQVEQPSCLEHMVALMREHEDFGAIGGEIFEGPDRERMMTLKTVCANGETRTLMIDPEGVQLQECDYLPTCNCLMRRDVVEQLGGFDACYFILSEDKELGWRLRKLGLRSITDSRTAALHRVSPLARRGDLFRKHRNSIRFALINMGWLHVVLLPLLDLWHIVRRRKVSDLKKYRQSVMKHLDGPVKAVVKRGNVPLSLLVVGPVYLAALVGAYLWNLAYLPATLWTRWHRPNFLDAARAIDPSDPPPAPALPRWARVALPYAVTIGMVAFILSRIGLRDVAGVMWSADLRFVLAATVFSCLANTVAGADKWRRVVNYMGAKVTFRESLFIRLGAGPIRFVAPSKSGELVKPVYVQRWHGLPFVRGTSSLVLDKVFNFWGVLLFLFVGLPLFGHGVPWYVAGLPALFIIVPVVLWSCRRVFYRLAERIHGKLHTVLSDLLSAFEVIGPKQQAFLLAYSVLFQATEVATCFMICRAVRIDPAVPFHKVMVFVPIVIIFSNIPIPTFSGIGLREAAMVTLLPHFGYGTVEQAAAVGLLLSTVEYLIPAAIGVPVLPAFLRALGGAWRPGVGEKGGAP